MAKEKKPSVQIKQKQQQEQEAPQKVTWFEQEKHSLPVAKTLAPLRKFKLFASNTALDFKDNLQNQVTHEFETGLGFNMIPVFMGLGIITYFSVPVEPSLIVLAVTFSVLAIVVWKLQIQNQLYWILSALTVMFFGMLVAQLATLNHHTPMLERQITTELEGVILGIDRNRRGAPRYLVKPTQLGKMALNELPRRIRLSVASKHQEFSPGDGIKGLARLQPVSGPVYPGGYDFSFFAWHQGMGGSGFFMGKPHASTHNNALDFVEYLTIQINKARLAIEKRLLQAMPDDTGKIAVALVTGNKTYIPSDVQDSLRKTGLAHILAISGLHMALVTLTVIWGVRFILVNVSTLALHHPIKKWAVGAGFLSATTYLMLSGAGIATQRAWVMISVMLLAAMMDRRAITMRSVAVSAIIILIINPQSILSPGFQMSFAAVTALVAGYETLNKRRKEKAENSFVSTAKNRFAKVGSGVFSYFVGIAITSLIAGTATAFIAAWHFHQVAPYGLLANLIAMPIVSILIMPFVLFSVLLMPYGLEFIPLGSVSFGIQKVVAVSSWVESISPEASTGLMSRGAILVFAVFLIWLCLFKTRLRFLAFMPLLVLPLFFKGQQIPDVIISENGRAIAIKTSEGKLGLLFPRGNKFVQNIWLKAWSAGEADKLDLEKEQCNRERCITVLPNSKILHVVYNPDLIQSSCQRADLLIAPRLWWVKCKKRQPELKLSRYDFERFGTHALYMSKVMPNAKSEIKKIKTNTSPKLNTASAINIRIEKALPKSRRPWHRHVTHPDDAKNLF